MKKTFKRKMQIRFNALARRRQHDFYGGMEKVLEDINIYNIDMEIVGSRLQHVLEKNPDMEEERLIDPPEVRDYIFNAAQKDIDSFLMHGAIFFAGTILTTAAAYAACRLGNDVNNEVCKAIDYSLASLFTVSGAVFSCLSAASSGVAIFANYIREPRLTEEERRLSNYIWMPEKEEGRKK